MQVPEGGISGLLNGLGDKTRLSFRLELDQLIISTNAHTQKVELESIRNFINEPIVGMEGHHIVGFQLGPTEKSIYWVYFVPAQYIKKIRSAIGI